jgi:DNA adenine methylase
VLLDYKILISYKQSNLKIDYLINQNPLLKWVGSKKKQKIFISSKLPKVLNNYHELFLGGASVLLQVLLKVKLGHITVLGNIFVSDLNESLINFYKVIQSNLLIFIRFLKKFLYLYNNLTTIKSKSDFYYKIRDKFNTLSFKFSAVKNAVYFYYLNKSCFRGLYRCNKQGEFNVPFGNYLVLNFNANNFIEFSILVRDVFFSVCNYSKYFPKIIKGDIIYLDPPYFGNNIFIDYLKERFNYLEFLKFIKKLEEKKFSYILSNILNDEILSIFSSNIYKVFYLEAIEGMVNKKKQRMEVLITFL